MSNELTLLAVTAATIGFFHTLLGPDHYLPFIMISKARNWTMKKLILVTFLCGLGHVAGSVIFGVIGITVGIAISKIEYFESIRGDLAAWAFIAFGFIYLIWGLKRAVRKKPHTHKHFHNNGIEHNHKHSHFDEHTHVHANNRKNITPWVLFIIFVLGPCEPLIPILMYPAAQNSVSGIIIITLIFSITTIATMLGVVIISHYGIKFIPLRKMEKYSHALAGLIIMFSGLGIKFLGL